MKIGITRLTVDKLLKVLTMEKLCKSTSALFNLIGRRYEYS